MPRSAPSSFKGGGGILRGVDGTITDVQFSEYKPKDPKKKTVINGILTVLPDGATEPIDTFGVFVGGAEDFEIVNDGRGLDGPGEIGRNTEWSALVTSLADALKEAGVDEADFFVQDEDSTVADYSCLLNQRVRFDWRVNAKKTAKLGKRVDTKDKSKSYDREDLIITAYYGEAEAQEAPKPKQRTAPSAGKTVTKAAGGKPNGKAVEVDIAELAATKIENVLAAAKDKKILVSKLSVSLLTSMSKEPEYRDDVRKWAKQEENLASLADRGITFDKAKQVLSLEV